MSAHTHGPWHTGGTFFHNGDEHMSVWSAPLPGDQSGDQVCQYAKPGDARLIAVAPDLLIVALDYQRVRRMQRAYFKTRTQENLIASKQAEKELDAAASAAIFKATGSAS